MTSWTRPLLILTGVVALFVAAIAVMVWLSHDSFGLLNEGEAAITAYLVVVLLIVADAIVPIFPGETTLNTASVLASQGSLDLWLVIVSGAVGAIVGDNALYWIARVSRPSVEGRLEQLQRDSRIQLVTRILGERGPMLIVLGRYIPGVRFFVNASMGVLARPYRPFLFWTVIGGTTWSIYTCLLAYAVGSALDEYPLTSIIVSGAITTVLIAVIYWFDIRRNRAGRAEGMRD